MSEKKNPAKCSGTAAVLITLHNTKDRMTTWTCNIFL
jgi:hypothetical protein